MVRRKSVVAGISLFLSLTFLSWGSAPLQAASAKWDLWDDAADIAVPDTESKAVPAGGGETSAPDTNSAIAEGGSPPAAGTVPDNAAVAAAAEKPVAAEDGSGYQIGPGDVLDISVWKDEALSRSVVVLPDGSISFPLIGKVEVAGKTVPQVKEKMVKDLSRFVPELELSIDVKQSNSMMVYVIGRVNAPGRQLLNSNVTVLQALAMAGGLNPFANRNKIKIFRKEGDAKHVLNFRYNDVIDGNLETNVELKRGDVIVVP